MDLYLFSLYFDDHILTSLFHSLFHSNIPASGHSDVPASMHSLLESFGTDHDYALPSGGAFPPRIHRNVNAM